MDMELHSYTQNTKLIPFQPGYGTRLIPQSRNLCPLSIFSVRNDRSLSDDGSVVSFAEWTAKLYRRSHGMQDNQF